MLTGLETPVLGHTALMTTADSTPSETREGQLSPGLKPRHMTMIALGGIIGAGLFLGPSAVIALFVYLLIAAAQLRMRRQLERDAPEKLTVKMWLYPWLTWLSIIAIVRREGEQRATRRPTQAARPGAA
jgi:L-asparagine transporter-like permease